MELDGFEKTRIDFEKFGILLRSYEAYINSKEHMPQPYRDSNKAPNMLELMNHVAVMNERCGVPQSVYVIEECSELAKELTKEQRRKGDNSKVCDEACDVLAATLVLLHQRGVSFVEISDYIYSKWERALQRFYLKGEL